MMIVVMKKVDAESPFKMEKFFRMWLRLTGKTRRLGLKFSLEEVVKMKIYNKANLTL
jgi:hypothetical protein